MNLSLDTDREDWIRSLRLRIGALPQDPGPGDIENLLDRLTPVAWLAGCPDTQSIDVSHLPRRYRRHLVAGGNDDGHTALLIAWPPGYQSPVHDHAGLWGIELVLQGHSSESIGLKLDISTGTVKVHRRNVYRKLGISSQIQLLSIYLKNLQA